MPGFEADSYESPHIRSGHGLPLDDELADDPFVVGMQLYTLEELRDAGRLTEEQYAARVAALTGEVID